MKKLHLLHFAAALCLGASPAAKAQTPPLPAEVAAYTGLHRAAQYGDVRSLNQLVAEARQAEINARDGNGRTPLHVATFARQRGAIAALVKAGADLNALDTDKYDAVTIAAVADDEDTLRLLLGLGASARLGHWTAVIEAIVLGDGGKRHQAVLQALIEAGANLALTDRNGATPLELARARGFTVMVEMLQKAAVRRPAPR